MTPSVVIGVWTGGDSPLVRFRSGSLGSGAHSALPVFARIIREIGHDETLKHYTMGDFGVTVEIQEMLNCQDYSERRGLRVNAKHEKKSSSPQKSSSQETKKESGVKKFFRKVFEGKKSG